MHPFTELRQERKSMLKKSVGLLVQRAKIPHRIQTMTSNSDIKAIVPLLFVWGVLEVVEM